MSSINQVVQQLQIQRKRAEQELEKLNLALKALSSLDGGTAGLKLGIRRSRVLGGGS